MHLVAAELAAHVRAGRTLAQAIADVPPDLPEPAAVAAHGRSSGDRPGHAADRRAGSAARWPDASVLARRPCGCTVGGDLATLLDGPAELLHERDAQRRAAEVATAQARATAGSSPRCRLRRCWVWR